MKNIVLSSICLCFMLACQPSTMQPPSLSCQKKSFPDGQVLTDETMEKEEGRLIAAGVLQARSGTAYQALARKLAAEDAITLSQLGTTFECETCLWECRFQDENDKAPLGVKIRNMKDVLLQDLSLAAVANQFLDQFDDEEWEDPMVKFTFLGFVHNLTQPKQEKGIHIKLPAWKEGIDEATKLKNRNILSIVVNAKGEILVRDKPLPLEELTTSVKVFIGNPNRLPDLADSPRQAIIALSNERETPYKQYLMVYNTIRAAYQELWNEYALANFGQPYEESLPDSIKRAIKQAIPFVVSEAEPNAFD